MSQASLIKTIFSLSVLGTLFALTVTLRQAIAPTGEPGLLSCAGLSIWGLSPCPYGLALFTLAALLSGFSLFKTQRSAQLLWPLRLTATAGVLFSGWVAWRELCVPALALGRVYWETFSLARVPACVWGFFVFAAICSLSFKLMVSKS